MTRLSDVHGFSPEAQLLVDTFLHLSHGVLHVGGHLGQEAQYYAAHAKPVLWIEANPPIAERLNGIVADFEAQREVQACVSDADGKPVELRISSNDEGASSSLFEFGAQATGEGSIWPELDLRMIATVALRTTRIDTLFASLQLDPAQYDHWVLDIQGAELLALKGARDAIRHCRSMVIEASSVDIYSGGAAWEDLRRHLEGQGFVPLWECVQHMDVLFVRREWRADIQAAKLGRDLADREAASAVASMTFFHVL